MLCVLIVAREKAARRNLTGSDGLLPYQFVKHNTAWFHIVWHVAGFAIKITATAQTAV